MLDRNDACSLCPICCYTFGYDSFNPWESNRNPHYCLRKSLLRKLRPACFGPRLQCRRCSLSYIWRYGWLLRHEDRNLFVSYNSPRWNLCFKWHFSDS